MANTAQVVKPSFGVRIGNMINFVKLSREKKLNHSALEQSWAKVESDVLIPEGIGADTYAVPKEAEQVSVFVKEQVKPLSQKIFGEAADAIFKRMLETKSSVQVIREEAIEIAQLKRAKEMELINELPANALIKSALLVQGQQTNVDGGTVATANFTLGILLGLYTFIYASQDKALDWRHITAFAATFIAGNAVLLVSNMVKTDHDQT